MQGREKILLTIFLNRNFILPNFFTIKNYKNENATLLVVIINSTYFF